MMQRIFCGVGIELNMNIILANDGRQTEFMNKYIRGFESIG